MPDPDVQIRIAMWSGPRNISTAMMRSWGNRPDTAVIDEPLYAYYLERTGKAHPGVMEIIAEGEPRVYKILEGLTGPVPGGRNIFYQKHMTHHLLPEVDRQWLRSLTNCFLIRDPAEVITSYIQKNDDPSLEDLGFVQQAQIFDWVRERVGAPRCGIQRHSGSEQRSALSPPIVIDAKDVLQNPERILRLLCDAVGVEFDDAMLSWPAGLRETDGIWAKYWYDEVARSTSFQPYRSKNEAVPDRLREIHDRCRECYDRLYECRLH
jgi:hypothetical protein